MYQLCQRPNSGLFWSFNLFLLTILANNCNFEIGWFSWCELMFYSVFSSMWLATVIDWKQKTGSKSPQAFCLTYLLNTTLALLYGGLYLSLFELCGTIVKSGDCAGGLCSWLGAAAVGYRRSCTLKFCFVQIFVKQVSVLKALWLAADLFQVSLQSHQTIKKHSAIYHFFV